MNIKKIQRWIITIGLIILMIGTMTTNYKKHLFFASQPSDSYSNIVWQDITFIRNRKEAILSVATQIVDNKIIHFLYKWKKFDINLGGLQNLELRNKKNKNLILDFFNTPDTKILGEIQTISDGWTWYRGENLYDFISTKKDIEDLYWVIRAKVVPSDLIGDFRRVSLTSGNLNIDHLFPINPDYENLRIEKKSDVSAEIFYAIEPTAPATIPAGYNFQFTRLEAEYASAENLDDVRSVELSFNAQRQAYSAVLENLEGETDYVINRLIWHYTLTDQSDSSKSYSLFSDLPLPPAANSFNLNNLDTDVYVIAAAVKPRVPVRANRNSHSLSETSSNLTTIIAISAGVGGTLLLFGGLGYWFYRRRKKS